MACRPFLSRAAGEGLGGEGSLLTGGLDAKYESDRRFANQTLDSSYKLDLWLLGRCRVGRDEQAERVGDEETSSAGSDPGLRSCCPDREFYRRGRRARDDAGGRLVPGQEPRGAARRAAVRA